MPKVNPFAVTRVGKKRKEPLWKGPEVDGITYSMLANFLGCRERSRIKYIEGLQTLQTFSHKLEYGNMWHVCEEALAGKENWLEALRAYCTELAEKYKFQQPQIGHWYQVCKGQFTLYVDYWRKHPDVKNRKPLMQEEVFDVEYKLPSSRKVRMRGKFDSVDLIGKGIWLQENKAKGNPDETKITRQMRMDLQTMMYLVALEELNLGHPIAGVRYNVIRRPLSGGKGSIVQKKGSKNVKPETKSEYYARAMTYIENEPETYFMRWQIGISQKDIERFKTCCLNPILEQLCEWYDCIAGGFDEEADTDGSTNVSIFHSGIHWIHPFGLWNVLNEGGSSDYDEYLYNGNEVGLERVDELFPELKGA
jgi:hypothetical protein